MFTTFGARLLALLPIREGILFINLRAWTFSSQGSLDIGSQTTLCWSGAVIVQQDCFPLSLTTTGPAAKNQFLKCETIDKIKSNPIDD